MEKLKIREAIVVEGRYDKNTLSQLVDAVIIETSGFGIFSNKEKLKLLRDIADKRGLIILTDSDRGGELIRKRLKSIAPGAQTINLYIPRIKGKEKRKKTPSKQGYLGVEGMDEKVLTELFTRAGLVDDGCERKPFLDRARLYSLGLMGKSDSSEKRKRLSLKLGIYEELSTSSFLESVNLLCSEEEFTLAYEALKEP